MIRAPRDPPSQQSSACAVYCKKPVISLSVVVGCPIFVACVEKLHLERCRQVRTWFLCALVSVRRPHVFRARGNTTQRKLPTPEGRRARCWRGRSSGRWLNDARHSAPSSLPCGGDARRRSPFRTSLLLVPPRLSPVLLRWRPERFSYYRSVQLLESTCDPMMISDTPHHPPPLWRSGHSRLILLQSSISLCTTAAPPHVAAGGGRTTPTPPQLGERTNRPFAGARAKASAPTRLNESQEAATNQAPLTSRSTAAGPLPRLSARCWSSS